MVRYGILLALALLLAVGYFGCSKGDNAAKGTDSSTVHNTPSSRDSAAKVQDNDPIVYITRTGAKYHSAGCRYLAKSCIPKKLSEVKGRYGPCSQCNPPQ